MTQMGRPRAFDRDLAVDKAVLLFWRHGFDSTSLSQLKEELGISAASFYAAFGSKEGLFREAITRYVDSYGRATSPLWNSSISPSKALEQALTESARMQTDKAHPLGCLLVISTTTSAENEHLQTLLSKARRRIREGINACLLRARLEGEVSALVSIEILSEIFCVFLFGLTTQARDGASYESLKKAIDAMMALVRSG
ncbi:TetR/AcrR family transcriptional repressor for divergent bdcA [Pseudomonas sp. JUb42]|jgi:TetR/AcrR family transcriptional repressor for divergent bdcA|uniref:TetR/AcrR family transcriptional regulator n=1 Tax=Pseudomonas sp. JUb42 TaxID=2940611 RepID=UPI0021697711|nr:TetR/AcrR family transcriptional regulator [Pseudomonas sp. JUb42]MCS3470111.1 TetR/AcrR family transcriptional repressor for divergent bdcA [Pseudomonas sp. JUb42]